ncbi:hypothetical protein [Paenibacillus polymyxa]|uniref:Uncharacterized protein n=1 Tax=Paenibacillus polymyxa (strain SC2) TaxID=886882 RepID=E3ELC5_PAEPS|nr:hypothetical protein [Paenibacillus polymyxa]ADO59957.1 hypothetical protein PPSC2_28395 [Paenibacillus polymyxa SC2]WPQ59823.1 hypothetical protein SKN87_26400 [Paenibacillus polymyxa]
MLKELMDSYLNSLKDFNEKRNHAQVVIDKEQGRLEKLQKKIDKMKHNLYEMPHPNWFDSIFNPLAEALSQKLNKKYDFYGPFGLRNETTIYFMENLNISICNQDTWSITLYPGGLGDGIIYYQTGETKDGKDRNHVTDPNGFNMLIAPLPDSIEEIEKLLVHSKKS